MLSLAVNSGRQHCQRPDLVIAAFTVNTDIFSEDLGCHVLSTHQPEPYSGSCHDGEKHLNKVKDLCALCDSRQSENKY